MPWRAKTTHVWFRHSAGRPAGRRRVGRRAGRWGPSGTVIGRSPGEWRNRQTRWLQVPVSARTWGFKSPLAHVTSHGANRVRAGVAGDSEERFYVVAAGDGNLCDEGLDERLLLYRGTGLDGVGYAVAQLVQDFG